MPAHTDIPTTVPICLYGAVRQGRQLGRTIGIPTANVHVDSMTAPDHTHEHITAARPQFVDPTAKHTDDAVDIVRAYLQTTKLSNVPRGTLYAGVYIATLTLEGGMNLHFTSAPLTHYASAHPYQAVVCVRSVRDDEQYSDSLRTSHTQFSTDKRKYAVSKIPNTPNSAHGTPVSTNNREVSAVAETHLLGVTLDLCNARVRLQLLEYIRTNRLFTTLDALQQEIQQDIKAARAFFHHTAQ